MILQMFERGGTVLVVGDEDSGIVDIEGGEKGNVVGSWRFAGRCWLPLVRASNWATSTRFQPPVGAWKTWSWGRSREITWMVNELKRMPGSQV